MMTSEDFSTKYVEVVKLLSQAAGVFQYISESVRPKVVEMREERKSC